MSDQTAVRSQCEPFWLCLFLGNTSSLCAENTNAARTPHASELFRLPTLVPRTGQTISRRPKDAWLCARMAATTPDEITRWLAALEVAASQLSYRSALKLLSTCSGLARARVRQNVLENGASAVCRPQKLFPQRSGITNGFASGSCYICGYKLHTSLQPNAATLDMHGACLKPKVVREVAPSSPLVSCLITVAAAPAPTAPGAVALARSITHAVGSWSSRTTPCTSSSPAEKVTTCGSCRHASTKSSTRGPRCTM